jgi:hypothetical protein
MAFYLFMPGEGSLLGETISVSVGSVLLFSVIFSLIFSLLFGFIFAVFFSASLKIALRDILSELFFSSVDSEDVVELNNDKNMRQHKKRR